MIFSWQLKQDLSTVPASRSSAMCVLVFASSLMRRIMTWLHDHLPWRSERPTGFLPNHVAAVTPPIGYVEHSLYCKIHLFG